MYTFGTTVQSCTPSCSYDLRCTSSLCRRSWRRFGNDCRHRAHLNSCIGASQVPLLDTDGIAISAKSGSQVSPVRPVCMARRNNNNSEHPSCGSTYFDCLMPPGTPDAVTRWQLGLALLRTRRKSIIWKKF